LGVGKNRNANVLDLLSWHGHDKGGVRVPFGQFGEPLGEVIETSVRVKLAGAAADIAARRGGPRWLFLVGGPGNGKSQMVEEFIRVLGVSLGCERDLVAIVATDFARTPTPRKVEVRADGNGAGLGDEFRASVAKLVIIQDASASDRADTDAAQQLIEDLENLLTEPRQSDEPAPVLICCVNRGLLARTLMALDTGPAVVDLLEALTRATGLGEEALSKERPRCWPVVAPIFSEHFPEMKDVVACWPMDMESLLFTYDEQRSPASTILDKAVSQDRWEGGGCEGCDYKNSCPLYQNAAWLRQQDHAVNLLRILRRQELATGQRWNFRSLFSLVAEMLVGEWEDFSLDGTLLDHPCSWVHQVSDRMVSTQPEVSVPASFNLVQRLYPHALFVGTLPSPSGEVREVAGSLAVADPIVRFADTHSVSQGTSIRRRLQAEFLPAVDPARWSPVDETDALYQLDDAYSQSVALGNEAWPSVTPPAVAEQRLMSWLSKGEEEYDVLAIEQPARAIHSERYIRRIAAVVAKRSVSIRLGRHADEEYLAEYENAIRDPDRLADLQAQLRELLSGRFFRTNALATFGQAENTDASLVRLVSNPVPVLPIRPAPWPRADMPAHDLPAIPVARRAIPLTFDLFAALRLRDRGCSSGSMPASVRAALDRIKQLYAGEVCRKQELFLAGDTYFEIDLKGNVILATPGGEPRFRANAK
jgi:hypothetical protein